MKMDPRQMIQRLSWVALAVAVIVIAMLVGRLRAQVLIPKSADLRFEMLLNEPIATAGRDAVVAGTSASVVRDRRSGQCYVAITVGRTMAMAPGSCGP
jgi:hypothetical protein